MADLYRKVAYAIIGSYIAMNLANKRQNGKWMFQNPPGIPWTCMSDRIRRERYLVPAHSGPHSG